MDEHDDDLESEVHEDVQQEADSYPDTDEEHTQAASEEAEEDDEELSPGGGTNRSCRAGYSPGGLRPLPVAADCAPGSGRRCAGSVRSRSRI